VQQVRRVQRAPIDVSISRETLILFAICFLDMMSSAIMFQNGLAVEANPLLRGAADAGFMPFVIAKSLTFVPALMAAEWYRRQRPEFVLPLLRWAAAAYAAIYVLLVGRQLMG